MLRSFAALAAALLVVSAAPAGAQTATHSAEDQTVTNTQDGTNIAITVMKPAGASADAPVPVVLHSHGWAGERETSPDDGSVKPYLDAGFGIVSIDQRGHGESDGLAYTQDPTRETEDIQAVIDYIATLDWVRLDGPGDPVLAAIGGSYGGGYQTMTALDEIAETGSTRFNALAPQITWYDLPQSLAPQDVIRSLWNPLLYAVGADMLPDYVHTAFAWGTATGQWPDGTLYNVPGPGIYPDLDKIFHRNSPVSFVEEGHQIDVPVLIRQGLTDTLFPLNEGMNIFDFAVSDEARDLSYFIGYHGGHVLPQTWPRGTGANADPCSPGGFTDLTIAFFSRVFVGESTDGLLPHRYNFSNVDGRKCIAADSFDEESQNFELESPGTGVTVTPTGAGAPIQIPIAQGPITVAGLPTLSGTATALSLDSRAFFGLSMGPNDRDARLIQNNVMPLRVVRTTVEKPFELELAGVAAEVPEGQTLYLTITPTADAFATSGTRPAGGLVLGDLKLMLPAPVIDVVEQVASQLTLSITGRGSRRQLVATVTDASGQAIPGAAVDFFGDDTALGTATTDGAGAATLDLPPRYQGGHHHFEATFAGNEAYTGSSGAADS